jgi:DNA-binding CsgD family transcriptional regulator
MGDRESLSRLTERERVCLRQWLQHKSAKEIAADLGISHHAVEKRLKMARTKLGATSSLEAARMLAETEGYGRTVPQSPDLVADAVPLHTPLRHPAVVGAVFMILAGAIALALLLHPAALSQAPGSQSAGTSGEQVSAPASAPTPGTEAAVRSLVAGLASGSPDYGKLSPQFADVVRRDLPRTHPLFSGMGELKSVTYRGRGGAGDDTYDLVFANGEVVMSAALDADGRMLGGILRPVKAPGSGQTAGTEAALRRLVAGLAIGSPDYDKLSPQFAEIVRRDLPMTHRMFAALGNLKSMTYRGRGAMGDDTYDLVFANGEVTMSAALDPDGRMLGGILQPPGQPGH